MAEANVKQVTDSDFEEVVLKAGKPCLVDFWAPWCGPCKAIGPVVSELADEYADRVVITKMNVDDSPATPGKYGIRAIPTLILFKGGEIVDQITGAVGKSQLVAMIQKGL
jgi:thioredoxin 1